MAPINIQMAATEIMENVMVRDRRLKQAGNMQQKDKVKKATTI